MLFYWPAICGDERAAPAVSDRMHIAADICVILVSKICTALTWR